MSDGDTVVAYARAQIGKPYVWDTAGPDTFDCSGLVVAAYKTVGKNLPHYTGALILLGSPVSKSNLEIGDLVFPEPTHVQIYSGNGMVVEAPHAGADVREVKLSGFWQGRRLVTPGTGSSSPTGASTAGDVTVSNPLNPLNWINEGTQLSKFFSYVTSAEFWERFGLVALGGMLILISILFVMRKQAEQAAGTIAKAAVIA